MATFDAQLQHLMYRIVDGKNKTWRSKCTIHSDSSRHTRAFFGRFQGTFFCGAQERDLTEYSQLFFIALFVV